MSAVSNTIFDNYLTAYGAPKISKYDTHKKSELRSTYNSIVKANKDAPWYLPIKDQEAKIGAIGLKESARTLRSSLAEIGGLNEDGAFNKKHASSTNPDTVSVDYIGDDNSDSVPSFDIEVKQLASPQVNVGRFLSDIPSSLAEDNYSFDVSIGDMNYEFQFHIGNEESNRSVQNRLVRLINNAGIGLSASLEESGAQAAIKITSDSSGVTLGRDRIFNISDDRTSKASGSVDYFGLGMVESYPTNAVFSLNGEDRHASSNHFTIGRMYEVSLNDVSPEGKPTTISIKADIDSVEENVSQLIGSFNDFLRAVNSYTGQGIKTKLLDNELGGITGSYRDALGELGINIESNGSLSIDSEKFRGVAGESDDIGKTFSTLKDFSNSMMKKSAQVSLDPMQYVNRKVVAYKNPGHTLSSPYTSSIYSGMMFNYSC
ncbi:MAG: flagellar filament capping protein FliD [Lachnospiraceae bacterium]|nr:flagellar filament capping protein FliD [Lachnospiraceae bacterium]